MRLYTMFFVLQLGWIGGVGPSAYGRLLTGAEILFFLFLLCMQSLIWAVTSFGPWWAPCFVFFQRNVI